MKVKVWTSKRLRITAALSNLTIIFRGNPVTDVAILAKELRELGFPKMSELKNKYNYINYGKKTKNYYEIIFSGVKETLTERKPDYVL